MPTLLKMSRLLVGWRTFSTSSRRHNVRENIHVHREPDFYKKKMLAACEPYIRREHHIMEEACKGIKAKEYPLHPLEEIYLQEFLDDIRKTDFLLLIQYNYTPFQSDRVYKNTLTKLGGKYQSFNNRIYSEAFKILDYKPDIRSLLIGQNAFITGQLDDLGKCVNSLRKMPQYLMLAGYVDKHLYNADQLKLIASSNKIDQCRANLLTTLQSPAIMLAEYLSNYKEEGFDG